MHSVDMYLDVSPLGIYPPPIPPGRVSVSYHTLNMFKSVLTVEKKFSSKNINMISLKCNGIATSDLSFFQLIS